ncbi:MAG TPA: cyclase family protein, partial [Geminicoccaceae bacterium]|nr:cyclase family protein [Geminicoccaceae bacterium]
PPVRAAEPKSFSRVIDFTHALGPDFPTYDGGSNLEMETLVTLAKDGYNMYRWLLVEHTGTHIDAPIHFGEDVESADEIPVEHLVVPLAVVDIRAKAQDDADAQLTPDDLRSFEAAHGPIPERACVAMLSGWDARASGPEFRNADGDGVMHFPGFHVEAAQYLMGERNAVGIAVDTLSLDYGQSADFATHYAWLPTNRWGLEAVAKLAELPPTGATLVVGGPKIKGATGGPSRVFALL